MGVVELEIQQPGRMAAPRNKDIITINPDCPELEACYLPRDALNRTDFRLPEQGRVVNT